MEMMDQLIVTAIESAYQSGFPLDAGAGLIIELDGLKVDIEAQAERVRAIGEKNRSRRPLQPAQDVSGLQALRRLCSAKAGSGIASPVIDQPASFVSRSLIHGQDQGFVLQEGTFIRVH